MNVTTLYAYMNRLTMKKRILLMTALGIAHSAHAAVGGAENCRVIMASAVEVPAETLTWKGPCLNGYAEGNGVLLRAVKGKQIGSFEGRMAQGMMAEGYEKRPDGAQYEGQYESGLRHGKGTWINSIGNRYDGQWKADKRAGKGVASYATGGTVDGEWLDDAPTATSKVVFAGGRVGSAAELQAKDENKMAGAKTYSLKSQEFSFNRFGDKIATGGSAPLNKGYAQMTSEQQQYVRRAYPLLHPDDVPPCPEKGAEQIFRWLSEMHRMVGEEGSFLSMVDVDASGKVTAITVFESPGAKITDFIKRILFRQIFSPAQCNGAPCAMRYPFNVEFTQGTSSGYH